MIQNLHQISLSPIAIAGSGLWAIALYWGFYPTSQAFIQRLSTWLSGDVALVKAGDRADFWAGMVGVIPFVGLGIICFLLLSLGLGQSWALSMGLMGMVGGGIYELGRRNGQQS
ncbi:hypothetical protein [Parathermosynechococcus lividus]|jgi:hypothetical protein|uniref:Uncharacterized protein n=1 Tax=Parathermosynechococcus lividus PCC 6715 TaxID=1917166 RepID=A0A2D2Q4E0_PARLV|nr:hypothetical protein [Thermostichus lividus]ATS19401.1 hypothetical protein BRW62_12440 [Thermostichus lividus PCC 6715]MCH9056347.1 hypothetical protein [Synechococcus sp. PCC 6716]